LRFAAQIVRSTRPDAPTAPPLVKKAVRWGAGPRAGQALILGAKAHALLEGRITVTPADIRRQRFAGGDAASYFQLAAFRRRWAGRRRRRDRWRGGRRCAGFDGLDRRRRRLRRDRCGRDRDIGGFRDRRLATILKRCQDLRGQRLFQYVDEAGTRHHVESGDVNAYLHEAMGEDFSAKDFRTWAATLAAARALCMESAEGSAHPKKTINLCVKAVAGLLGNTAAVCRASYIHPSVFEAFEAGSLSPSLAKEADAAERALLRLLKDAG